ncbi:hypothetical protein [Streptomyces sp. NPDC048172]|uniref:hypothetical protein n=1 Tax=Streptomyces sp. NPDC048172 TaxID=3365505 RepID=UPI0037192B73
MLKRLAVVLSGLALALGGAVTLAPAVQATPQGCFYHVLERHPGADTAVVERACLLGAEGSPEAVQACYFEMRKDYIPAQLAHEACRRASQR